MSGEGGIVRRRGRWVANGRPIMELAEWGVRAVCGQSPLRSPGGLASGARPMDTATLQGKTELPCDPSMS